MELISPGPLICINKALFFIRMSGTLDKWSHFFEPLIDMFSSQWNFFTYFLHLKIWLCYGMESEVSFKKTPHRKVLLPIVVKNVSQIALKTPYACAYYIIISSCIGEVFL